MLADGNGAFMQALGLEMDATRFGVSLHWQALPALYAEDGVVKVLNVERRAIQVSSAEGGIAWFPEETAKARYQHFPPKLGMLRSFNPSERHVDMPFAGGMSAPP